MADRTDRAGLNPIEREHQALVELLPWYANGTLDAEERARVEAHLERCEACCRELVELEGLKAVLAPSPEAGLAPGLGTDTAQALQRTLSRLAPAAPAEPSRRAWLPWRWGRTRPRPALAFSLPLIVLLSLGLGVALGLQLAVHVPAIGERPGPGERAAPLTGAYFAVPRRVLDEGTFALTVGTRPMLQETFTLERQDDNTLLLSSNVRAGELAAVQRLVLTERFEPLSYVLQGPLVLGGRRAEAHVDLKARRATLSVCCTRARASEAGAEGGDARPQEQIQRRLVMLEDGVPALYDFSVPSHFALLYRAIQERLRAGASPDEVRFVALTPQALRAEPLRLARVAPSTLTLNDDTGTGTGVAVTRYELRIGPEAATAGEILTVELYAQDAEGTLLAVHIPVQPRLAASKPVTIYRKDLYPQGVRLPEPELEPES